MNQNDKIYIAGINGMVGSAIKRQLESEGYDNIHGHSSKELNLTNQTSVWSMFNELRPDYVFLAAAKVGGIRANNLFPADFIYTNLMIQSNIISNSYIFDVKKLLFLGSSCIYPKFAPQPINESDLMTGELEPTNDAYALAKISGIKMCQAFNTQHKTNFISCMPTNLYGPNDNYDPLNSHVLPGLIRRIHEAKKSKFPNVVIWGDGSPLREFLYVEDLAEACVFLMNNYDDSEIINVGSEDEINIKDLATLVCKIVGYTGKLVFDTDMPNGTPRKKLNNSKINDLGWKAKTELEKGIYLSYEDYLNS